MRPGTRSGPGSAALGGIGPLLLISACTLLQEIYWLRAFAEIDWAHVASMVVSTAMLGIGAGSVAILLVPERGRDQVQRLWVGLLGSTVVLLAAGSWLIGRLPLEPMLLLWRAEAWAWLLVRELLVALPLATAAAAITLVLRARRKQAGSTYGLHLLGAALGVSLGLLLAAVSSDRMLLLAAIGTAGLAAAFSVQTPRGRAVTVGLMGIGIALGWTSPPLPLGSTKDLHALRGLPGVRFFETRSGWEGSWQLLGAPALHGLPGTSLQGPPVIGPQRAIVVRGDHVGTVLGASGTSILRHRVEWLPFALRACTSVLVLGEGSALSIQAAQLAGARRVLAVLRDRRTTAALRGELGDFAGLDHARVELTHAPSRNVLARLRDSERFDCVLLPPHDSLAMASGGLGATAEDALLTVEGIAAAFEIVAAGGMLALSRWTQAPPRDLPKLLSTAQRALTRFGIDDLRPHLALLRSWDMWTLTIAAQPWTPEERQRLVKFAASHGFDVLLPVTDRSAPQHTLPPPAASDVIDLLFEEGLDPVQAQIPLDLRPATDDRPWFHHYLRLASLGGYLAAIREGLLSPADWGDVFLLGSLGMGLLLGAAFIAVPALVAARGRAILRGRATASTLFLTLGLGYMLLEVLWIHQASLVLEDPSVAGSIVILAFLLGSGTGSLLVRGRPRRGVFGAGCVAGAAVLLTIALSPARDVLLQGTPILRWGGVFFGALLLALPMGMPLPSALLLVDGAAVPWLLAINAWASVVGPAIATLIAIHVGLSPLVLSGALLYGVAALLLRGLRR